MLKLENVSKIYYNKGMIATGITKVNLELKLGEFVVITGESGSGKSTLLNVISGIDSYEEGEMYVNGKETSHYTEKDFEEYRRKYVANIFQNFNLINSYTVYQNIELILLLKGEKKSNIKKKILDIINKVGLTKFKNTKVSKLSGGQKQRVAIARAIIKDTPIIVADEPTGNLDTKSAEEIIELLRKVAKDKLVVMVTHNIEQVEQYATKIIKMHDGRIVSCNEIKKIKENKDIMECKYNEITVFNKIRLGIRNTFNIFSKFTLLFIVFLFMSIAFLTEYASFQLAENEADESGYSIGFRDISDNRILIKKQNQSAFTNEDYARIKGISNIDYIVEDDLFIDCSFSLNRDDMSFYGNILDIKNFRGNIDLGRKPNNDNEIILRIGRKHFYITNRIDEVLGKTFSIMNPSDNEQIKDLTIVGIQYSKDDNDYNPKFYSQSETLRELRSLVNKNYSDLKILFNNKYVQYNIEPNDNVSKGCVILDDDLKYQFKNYKIINQPVDISASNIYYEEKISLKVSNTFTKSNFKRLTGLTKYENYRNTLFINKEDYNSLFNKSSYQSSVYVKNSEIIEETMLELNNIGLKAKKVTDYKVDDSATYKQIIKIIKVVVTIVVIVVLFFISYLIVRIILKSRNVYFTTLRMLGASFKNIKRILDIELFINSSLSYISVLLFIHLVKTNIVNVDFIEQLVNYLSLREYIIMYIILFFTVKLLSRKFAKKIFKSTAMNIYNEEV